MTPAPLVVKVDVSPPTSSHPHRISPIQLNAKRKNGRAQNSRKANFREAGSQHCVQARKVPNPNRCFDDIIYLLLDYFPCPSYVGIKGGPAYPLGRIPQCDFLTLKTCRCFPRLSRLVRCHPVRVLRARDELPFQRLPCWVRTCLPGSIPPIVTES